MLNAQVAMIRALESVLSEKNSSLNATLKAPSNIVSPLPQSRKHALEVLFLMDMPHEIALLGEMSFIAQRALANAVDTKHLREDMPATPWRKHYNTYSWNRIYADATVVVCPKDATPPLCHNPNTVDNTFSEGDCARLCVWYPSGKFTKMFWQTDQGCAINPFKIRPDMTMGYFTHTLPHQLNKFQWAIVYPGGADRENLVYSKVRTTIPGCRSAS